MPGMLSLEALSAVEKMIQWLELGREGHGGGKLFSTGIVEWVPALLQPLRHDKPGIDWPFCVCKHRQLPARTTNAWDSLHCTSVLGWKAACLVGSQLESSCTVLEQAFMTTVVAGLSSANLLCAACRYGVGQIYFRQEKYEMAEYQFKRALQVYLLGATCCTAVREVPQRICSSCWRPSTT